MDKKDGTRNNVRPFRQVNTSLPPNNEVVEMLEELLDLAKVGELQQLAYCGMTQSGESTVGLLGYLEGYEHTFLGELLCLLRDYEDLVRGVDDYE